MKTEQSNKILQTAISQFNPTHIVSMVSGGKDSAASDAVARELNVKIDFAIHGNTRCGIPETTEFVTDYYGKLGDFIVADAGTTYESRVMKKGFYGVGRDAHNHSFRELKVTWFRQAISHHMRHGKRGVRVLMINGARASESQNRKERLKIYRADPASLNNVWVNLIHDWSLEDRDQYLESRNIPINPVAKKICRSGECMCGTMQSKEDRTEAAIVFPRWGNWIKDLDAEVKKKHGFGWGDDFPSWRRNPRQLSMLSDFESTFCSDCKI